MNRKLDYIPRLHPANRAYRITTADPALLQKSRYWPAGVVLDQGQEGSCVGHGVVGEYLASPVRGKLPSTLTAPTRTPAEVGHMLAYDVYLSAQIVDEWEGEAYDGTSVRAGMLVGRERGWYSGFRWAFNMLELRAALEEGPVVVGVLWTDGMYEAPDGILKPTGEIAGGHCVVLTGYTPNHQKVGGPAYRIRNSWSKTWGINGTAYIGADDLNQILFQAGGEAACPIGRAL